MRLRRTFLTLAATLAASLGAPGALAAPNNANTITLDLACSDGLYYSITLLETTPDQPAAHIVGSTSVLVPTAFQWHLIVTDAEGNVLDETTAPPEMVHGRSVDRLETLECTFTQFAHHDFPGVGPVTNPVGRDSVGPQASVTHRAGPSPRPRARTRPLVDEH